MKNFLKKIVGGKAEAPKEKSQVQRSPRVRIPLLDDSVFVATNGVRYPIRNLSESGMALAIGSDTVPDELNGDIILGNEKVYVEMLVVRRNGDEAGLTFGDGAAGVRGLLRRVFTEEFQALEMAEIDAKNQKPVAIGSPRWFYGAGTHELFFVEHEGKVLRMEMEWSGSFLAFADGVLRYGKVDKDFREANEHARSALVKWQESVPSEARVKALRILENVRTLDASLRKQMQDILKV